MWFDRIAFFVAIPPHTSIKESGITRELDIFPEVIPDKRCYGLFTYLACSSCKVLVGWSQTSVGPKYWIGPGYT